MNSLNFETGNSRFDYICLLDVDTKLCDDAISLPIKQLKDETILSVDEKIKIVFKKKSLIEQFQKYEYEKIFNLNRKYLLI